MARSIILGNGHTFVGFDDRGQIRDFHFPYVGLENHVGGDRYHRIGVFVDGMFSWFDDPEWNIEVKCESKTFAGNIHAANSRLGVEINFTDVVYNEKNILLRNVEIKNHEKHKRQIKIFFHQMFELYESHRSDTGFYDPKRNVIVHYKGKRKFLINATVDGTPFDDYTVGLYHGGAHEGSHKDAESGMLSKNPIEHGYVDSVIGVTIEIGAQKKKTVEYWIVVGKTTEEIYELNEYILKKTHKYLMGTTKNYWRAWLSNRISFDTNLLEPEVLDLFGKSLFIMRAHADQGGAIIASGDSEMLQYGKDTYNYMWPRDAAFAALTLSKTKDVNVANRFFLFSNDIIRDDGYIMHKFQSDKSLGSSWHPWTINGEDRLPIQEDETALVIYALWEHYQNSRNLEFVESIYNSLIKKAADFMIAYTDKKTGLPYPSYDLWEEKYGTSTFTASAVYGALRAAANFANILGKETHEITYKKTAEKMKQAILTYLYNDEERYFRKLIRVSDGNIEYDDTLDMSSIYGIYIFNVLDVDDERVKSNIAKIESDLVCKTSIGGVPRYQNDKYYCVEACTYANPWFITTFWLAQYKIKTAKTKKGFGRCERYTSVGGEACAVFRSTI